MPLVKLPEGARRIDARGRYTGSAGDVVRVSPGNAAAIERFRSAGPAHGAQVALGTKAGRWCEPCVRLWNAWSAACPNCGAETVPA